MIPPDSNTLLVLNPVNLVNSVENTACDEKGTATMSDPAGFDDWRIGDVVDGIYEVKGLLGEGGFGRVYQARHRNWNTDLAVKCLRPNLSQAKSIGAISGKRQARFYDLGGGGIRPGMTRVGRRGRAGGSVSLHVPGSRRLDRSELGFNCHRISAGSLLKLHFPPRRTGFCRSRERSGRPG